MKKDVKKLYTYGIIMIICVIVIILIAVLSESRVSTYEGQITQSQTQIVNLEDRIAVLEKENYELRQENEKNFTLQADIEKNNQVMNELTEIYNLIKNEKKEEAKEKLEKIDTNGFDNAALAFYEALAELMK